MSRGSTLQIHCKTVFPSVHRNRAVLKMQMPGDFVAHWRLLPYLRVNFLELHHLGGVRRAGKFHATAILPRSSAPNPRGSDRSSGLDPLLTQHPAAERTGETFGPSGRPAGVSGRPGGSELETRRPGPHVESNCPRSTSLTIPMWLLFSARVRNEIRRSGTPRCRRARAPHRGRSRWP